MDPLPPNTGIIVVDHGSRLPAANALLDGVVALYRDVTGAVVVEPAHMELAAPTLEDAVRRCIEQGARTIVVHPYFLAPGRHSTGDIPRMVGELAPRHPEVRFHVTEPLGLDPAMAGIMHRRILASLDQPR